MKYEKMKYRKVKYRKMRYRKVQASLLGIVTLCAVTGCGKGKEAKDAETESTTEALEHAAASTVTLTEGKYSEEKLRDTWDEESAVCLKLEKDEIFIEKEPDVRIRDAEGETIQDTDGNGVEIESGTVTITQEGTYVFSGELEDGQIIVDADKDDVVRLVLNGVSVAGKSSAPLYSKGGNVIVTLVDGTENIFEDANVYSYENEGDDEPDAAIFAKDDLTFNGTGTLRVTGKYNHAIHCKDDLKFITGTYVVSAVDDGIVGKDSVSVKNGNFIIESGDDGIKSSNIEDTDKGYVLIEEGSFQITAGGDGIQAETLLRVNDGDIEIKTGGGSGNAEKTAGMQRGVPTGGMEPPEGMELPEGAEPPEGMEPEGAEPSERMESPEGAESAQDSASMKAMKSYVDLVIAGGEFSLDSCDDAVHSNKNVEIENGVFSIQTGDDGIHADQKLTVNGGEIVIDQSYEGLEGFEIEINDGNIRITASDDGINAALSNADSNPETDSADDTRTESDGSPAKSPVQNSENADSARGGSDGSDDGQSKPEEPEGGQTKPEEPEAEAGGKSDSTQRRINEDRPGGKPDGEWKQAGLGGIMPGEDQGAVMTFNGGTIYVDAGGDGLDANGDIFINGGEITVHGPENGGNGTLDYANTCMITGGTFLGAGSVGMAQSPSKDSTQPVLVWTTDSAVEAGTVISVMDAGGAETVQMTTEKKAQWFALSSPKLEAGGTYTVCYGDTRKEIIIDDMN